jgi:hypothetical protein
VKKQMAGALVASLLLGSTAGWARAEDAATASRPVEDQPAERQQLRDSIQRAMEGAAVQETTAVAPDQPEASGPQLTTEERRNLDTRRAALKTDPVARGGAGMVMFLVGTIASIGLTAYLVKQANKTTTPAPSLARP